MLDPRRRTIIEILGVDNACTPGPSRASDSPTANIETAVRIDLLFGHAAPISTGEAYAMRDARKTVSGNHVIDDESAKYAKTADSNTDGEGVKDGSSCIFRVRLRAPTTEGSRRYSVRDI